VNIIRDISVAQPARAPKNAPAVFALALCATHGDEATKTAALVALPEVCRIPTDLFDFLTAYEALGGGWGRRPKRAVADWYLDKNPLALAKAVTKYQSRNGWSHRDVLRLAHPSTESVEFNQIFQWATKGEILLTEDTKVKEYLEVVSNCLSGKLDKKAVLAAIEQYRLPREVLPTQFLTDPDVWGALLPHMKSTALIRNLGNMTRSGLVANLSAATKLVCEKLNKENLVADRVHPVSILIAKLIYEQGRGQKGGNTWSPVGAVTAALEDAFYASFGSIEPMNKRIMTALDISGSMDWGAGINGIGQLTPRLASTAMAMVSVRSEPQTMVTAFTSGLTVVNNVTKNTSLKEAMSILSRFPHGGTDCSLPMVYARQNKIPVDVFQIYTDNETWAGGVHPCEALKQYREAMGINAKVAVFGMTATNFSIADPKDPGMLDVVGFDTAAPQIVREFAGW
jgi:60 kDa SS-A/Ro ribonucleoprotein